MFSKISELERFHHDKKRFSLAIDSTFGDTQQEGIKLYNELLEAVFWFDESINGLGGEGAKKNHGDHSYAQQRVVDAKNAIEGWVILHAPNIHV